MASVTMSVTDDFKERLKHFSWVNWSEIAREELTKKLILERYLQTRKLSDEDWRFCESIDWHPGDEMQLRKSFIKKMRRVAKQPTVKFKSVDDLFK